MRGGTSGRTARRPGRTARQGEGGTLRSRITRAALAAAAVTAVVGGGASAAVAQQPALTTDEQAHLDIQPAGPTPDVRARVDAARAGLRADLGAGAVVAVDQRTGGL